MPRWMAASLLAITLALSGLIPAQAQGTIAFSRLEVDLWPEYDRPEMLVIEHIVIDPSVSLPTNISVKIPAAAGNPYNLATRRADGNLYNLDYNRTTQGEWSEIGFSAPNAEIQLEYYDPGLEKTGAKRTFTFTWPGGFEVKETSIQVQQPNGATDLTTTPPAGNPVIGGNGLSYYTAGMGSYKATDNFTFKVSYQKANDNLSVETGQVEPSGPIDASTAGRANMNSIWYYVIGAIAILLIAGGGYWYWRTARKEELVDSRRRHTPGAQPGRKKETQEPGKTNEGVVYCHQCGKRAGPKDIFCRSCGARLKREES